MYAVLSIRYSIGIYIIIKENKKGIVMKRIFLIISLVMLMMFAGCTDTKVTSQDPSYEQITSEAAKELMDTETDYVIIDARTTEEFEEGHIPGAILLPDYDVREKAEELLTDKDQLILVYCRSGNRSKVASNDLVELGYTNVKEFGGIKDWPYEIEK
jgi:rhodanese-related sulfurtransferase